MWAYSLPKWKGCFADAVPSQMPELERIAKAGALCIRQRKGGGIYAAPKALWADGIKPDLLAEGVAAEDGLVYHAPASGSLALSQLARDPVPGMVDVRLHSGVVIRIHPAVASARVLSFGIGAKAVATAGEYCTDYARSADELYALSLEIDKLQADGADEQRVASLIEASDVLAHTVIMGALRSGYYVTEEVVNAGQWISTSDVSPICLAAWGASEQNPI